MEPTFWRPLARARAASGGDLDEQVTRLTTRLAALSPAEIVAFDDLIWTMLTRAYRHDLWAAAYLINGGCSDDRFDSFIGWLIAPNGDSWANPGTRRRSSGSFRAWPPAASPPRGATAIAPAARAPRPPIDTGAGACYAPPHNRDEPNPPTTIGGTGDPPTGVNPGTARPTR
jgi:hypothetical protein